MTRKTDERGVVAARDGGFLNVFLRCFEKHNDSFKPTGCRTY
jgi:hypothetical protein